ncbi:MAG: hypothetical protein ABIK28_14015 [Planctomycetota bacterium]
MNRRYESGKSGIMMGMVFIGILLIVGVIILVNGLKDDQLVNGDLKSNVEPVDREIVNTIDEPDPVPEEELVEEEGEELPAMLKTVDGTGRTVYIGTDKVDIVLPGKGTVKATKLATATNKKMKAYNKKPSLAKPDHILPHPSKRNNKGEKRNKGDDKPKGGGDEGNSGTSGSGNKMGGGGK